MISESELQLALKAIESGQTIVYPTESVFGLGCDPWNQAAVENLLQIKQRPVEKGMILIASHVQQVLPLIKPHSADDLARALKTWPGHNTWIFPKSDLVPHWISGQYDSIAVRVSQHPVVKQLCDARNQALVSTSANVSNHDNLHSISDIKKTFGDKIGFYVDAPTGDEKQPSTIRNAQTGAIIR